MKNIFLLDLDDTLLDFKRAERVNFTETMEKFGIVADDALYCRFHAINEGLWRLLERGGITRAELLVRRFTMLAEECGFFAPPELAGFYFENFRAVCFPFAGSVDFVRSLADMGRVYIVTNGSTPIQNAHLRAAGFLPYVAGAFISDQIGADKPSKAFSDYVKAHIPAFDEGAAVWLGDSLTSDMVCAEGAGIDFLLFAPEGRPQGYAGRLVRDFEEALVCIRAL